MARYDRRFLIPYLENLCALLLAKDQIDEQLNRDMQNTAVLEEENEALQPPWEPYQESVGMQIMGIIVAAFLIIVSFMDIIIISFLSGIVGWVMLISGIIWLKSIKERNDEAKFKYRIQYDEYVRKQRELDEALEKSYLSNLAVATIHDERNKKITAEIDKMYSVNIIPRRYRDKYAVAYLYDWFSTGGSDNMDMALNTYVLEEIKERLDIIINQLSQSLLNQQIMVAQQYKTQQMQQQYHDEMMGQLRTMQVAAEEQTCYLEMIEANTSALTFFAAADYLRHTTRTRR